MVQQYPIPQFIESEGKIIFFLTFRQFFILVGGGACCFVLYFLLPLFLFVICSLLIMLLAVIIAFFKINHTSVVIVFLNFVGFLVESKNYTWKKESSSYLPEIKIHQETENIEKPPALEPKVSKLKSIQKIIELRK